jgi:inner membrane protein
VDSLSQAALGGAVGQAVIGRRIGGRAAAWGAAIATLPDLDVFVPLGNEVLEFTAHRSATHSLPLMALATPALAWGIARWRGADADERRRWMWLVGLCLWTHALLDAFTVYGTQLLWPFTAYPVIWGSVFIIDPAYTLPLLAGLVVALLRPDRWRWNHIGLLVSSLYLPWTVGAQAHVRSLAWESLRAAGHDASHVLATPAPFTTLLWRILAMEPHGHYHEGWISLVDGDEAPIEFVSFDGQHGLLEGADDIWAVDRLRWFTHGYYAARAEGEQIVMTDLRMGFEPRYVFAFAVARRDSLGALHEIEPRRQGQPTFAPEQFPWLGQRLFDAGAGPPPR